MHLLFAEGYVAHASKLTNDIIAKAKSLSKNHYRGREEEVLKPLGQGHRYLLAKNHFKIIYLVEETRVAVTDIFDARQDPGKLLKTSSK